MKKLLLIPAFALLVTSCELIKEATQIDIEGDFTISLDVDLVEGDNSINEIEVLNIDEDEDVSQYKDVLEEIIVDSLVLKIENYVGPDVLTIDGSLSYSEESESSGTDFSTISGLDVANLYKNNSGYKLQYSEVEIANITDLLIEKGAVKIFLNATASEVPVSFELKLKLYSNIVAQPLK